VIHQLVGFVLFFSFFLFLSSFYSILLFHSTIIIIPSHLISSHLISSHFTLINTIFTPGFIGFHNATTPTPTDELSSPAIPEELRLELKQLRKKDEKTKLKALTNLTTQMNTLCTEVHSFLTFISQNLTLSPSAETKWRRTLM
jgi:hypothetical protein